MLTCLSQIGVIAQNTITLSGKITDQHGTPLSLVTIAVENTTSGTYTDDNGRYSLKVSPGKCTLVVSLIGYQTVRSTSNIQQNKTLNFTLEESAVTLNSVEVYGKTQTQKVKEGVFSVNALDIKPIVNSLNNLNDLVNRTTGIKVREEGGVGSDFDLSINGLSGNSIRYFLDGMPLDTKGSGVSLANLPVNIIDRIEIYKGVVPASLGTDALGGAINIILKNRRSNQLVVSYSAGSFNTHLANLYGSYYLGRGFMLSASLYYNYSKNNYWVWGKDIFYEHGNGQITKVDKVRRFHDAYRDYGTRLALSLNDRSWVDQLSLNVIASGGYKEIQHGARMNRVYGNRHRNSRMIAVETSYRKDDILTDGLSLDIQLSYTNNQRVVVDTVPYRYDWSGHPIVDSNNQPIMTDFGAEVKSGITGGPSLQTDISHTFTTRASLAYTFLEHHTLTARWQGTYFLRNSYDPLVPKYITPPDQNKKSLKSIASLSLEDSWLEGRLKNSLFYKQYYQQVHAIMELINPTTGKLENTPVESVTTFHGVGGTLSYKVLDGLYLHASAERAIRLPSELELFGNAASNVSQMPNLKPERSNNFNLGTNFGTYHLGPLGISGSGTLFVRDTRDMIREKVMIGPTADYSQFENVDNILSRGIDTECSLSLWDKLFLTGSYSYTKATYNNRNESIYGLPLRHEPPHKANLNLRYLIPNLGAEGNTLTLGANLFYVSKFPVDLVIYSTPYVPHQSPVSLSVSYTLLKGALTVSFDAKNIFNQQIFDNYALQKPGRAFFGKLVYTLQ
ncbi:TonB-dependent receptor [uncultured Porphyromonas sp.]|uniref:TonB-dependent receptor n=1 Tax=uncultured Porphyromonas sp. TaxID=159274 RepID=UPI00260B2770|nr:TonB-dependent receptor [uncultured Porphyromonas sp.]